MPSRYSRVRLQTNLLHLTTDDKQTSSNKGTDEDADGKCHRSVGSATAT